MKDKRKDMEEQLITFETAKSLKEKGFDIPVFRWYYSIDGLNGKENSSTMGKSYLFNHSNRGKLYYSTPTQSLLQRWLREVHNIHVVMKPVLGSKNGYDSFPMIGWDFDIIMLNKDSTNSYYMGYPIGDWFTGIVDQDEEDSLEDIGVRPKLKYEDSLELGLLTALKYIK
jgi:hypothetical protein